MRQGDFENAQLVLDKALTIAPDNLDLLKRPGLCRLFKTRFLRFHRSGKKITARPDADVQSFQILGLAYKAIAMDKERDKMYKDALKKVSVKRRSVQRIWRAAFFCRQCGGCNKRMGERY